MDYLTKLSGKKIAVIGAGYVGSRLIKKLESKKNEIGFDVLEINRRNLKILETEAFDFVFNCAGNTGDFRSQPVKTVESNIGLTTYLLENCSITESLVCLSSTRIYGFSENPDVVFTEDVSICEHHLSLSALYNDAKKLMECLLINTPRTYKKIVLRLSNVFGDYDDSDLNDSTFLKLMLRHKKEATELRTNQNLFSTKDYIFIEDALDGILRGGILSESDDFYNICSGQSYSIQDWTNFLQIPVEQTEIAARIYSNISNDKAKREIGFTNKSTLENLNLTDVIKL